MKKIEKDRFIISATIGPKGQIVIPKIARDMFNLETGQTLLIMGDKKRGLAIVTEEHFYKKMGMDK